MYIPQIEIKIFCPDKSDVGYKLLLLRISVISVILKCPVPFGRSQMPSLSPPVRYLRHTCTGKNYIFITLHANHKVN